MRVRLTFQFDSILANKDEAFQQAAEVLLYELHNATDENIKSIFKTIEFVRPYNKKQKVEE